MVSKRFIEDRDLDETITREEVVAALCIALGKPDFGDQCRLYKRFGGVKTAVVHLNEADVSGARAMAMCCAAARFQAGRMPVGGVAH